MTADGAMETRWSMDGTDLLLMTEDGSITTRFDRLQITAGNHLRVCGLFVLDERIALGHYLDSLSSEAPLTERRLNVDMSLTAESDSLLIIFNSAGSPAIGNQSKWEFAKLTESVGVDYIRVAESKIPSVYYLDKVDGLRRMLAGLILGQYRTVLLIGMSSGGYASMLFAELLARDLPGVAFRSLVINPQTGYGLGHRSFLNGNVLVGFGPELPDERGMALSDLPQTDIADLVHERIDMSVDVSHDIFYDSDNQAEVYYLSLVAGLPGFQAHPIALGLPHADSSIAIYRTDLLQAKLRAFLQEGSLSSSGGNGRSDDMISVAGSNRLVENINHERLEHPSELWSRFSRMAGRVGPYLPRWTGVGRETTFSSRRDGPDSADQVRRG